ncbi:HAD-like protein [Fomitiporia mediterranea MF3/22]|uniref:HAD-like protein n=1 Tax=Fomitiporia mediterranea (strain MF3/22) TaxID=694068 RepID=UPI0004408B36|nr:HAD-like protein [Fomitiporia mediterranea MF3/22]EJD05797.1 HAD-like protein [Fomitiporia mediterranea MF3/22]
MPSSHLKAVIFDIGGVVVRSPLLAISAFEEERGLPRNYINCAIAGRAEHGAWQRFERGELALFPFYDAFSRELSDTRMCNVWYTEYCKARNIVCPKLPENVQIDGRDLFGWMMRESTVCDENMVEAIRRIRAVNRWRVIALTNNYSKAEETMLRPDAASMPSREDDPGFNVDNERAFLGWTEGATSSKLRELFDDFCDSSSLGMRKPEPEFYLLACRRNGVQPTECVFLDDLGINLKVARQLGMKTIRVPIGGSLMALRELELELGIDLTGPRIVNRL